MKQFTILLILAFSAWTTTYALPVLAPDISARFDFESDNVELFRRQDDKKRKRKEKEQPPPSEPKLRRLAPKPSTNPPPTPGPSNHQFASDPKKGVVPVQTFRLKVNKQQPPPPATPGSSNQGTRNKKAPTPGTGVFKLDKKG